MKPGNRELTPSGGRTNPGASGHRGGFKARTAQFIQDCVCRQQATPEALARLKANPVVLWVKLPGAIHSCGHYGYLVESVQQSRFNVTNLAEIRPIFPPLPPGGVIYVCEHMGHLIE